MSWFHYRKEDLNQGRTDMPTEVKLFQRFDFSDHLQWLSDDTAPTSPTGYIRKQLIDFLVDETGRVTADHILRQETLTEDLARLNAEECLDIEVPSIRVNASNHSDFRRFYNDAGIELVTERHAKDIEYFGYSFEREQKHRIEHASPRTIHTRADATPNARFCGRTQFLIST